MSGFSLIAEISNSVELCLALSVQHLKHGCQIAFVYGDSSPTKPRMMRFNAPQPSPGSWIERFEGSIRSTESSIREFGC